MGHALLALGSLISFNYLPFRVLIEKSDICDVPWHQIPFLSFDCAQIRVTACNCGEVLSYTSPVIIGSSQKQRVVYLCNTSTSTTLRTLDTILQLKDTDGGGPPEKTHANAHQPVSLDRYTEYRSPRPLRNPVRLLRELGEHEWVTCIIAFAASTTDLHSITTQIDKLSWYYNSGLTDVSCCLAVSLVTRYVGAVIARLAGDMCGRKWPLVHSLIFTGTLQISGIYCEALESFIAVRVVLGITTGGIYGNAMAIGLGNCA